MLSDFNDWSLIEGIKGKTLREEKEVIYQKWKKVVHDEKQIKSNLQQRGAVKLVNRVMQ